jgi:sulfite reductase (NADPH) flavoprotein alpha-component
MKFATLPNRHYKVAMTEATVTATAAAAPPRYTRANPFPARMVVNRRLSGPESAKDTRHFELDLTGWGLSFEVGDSLAIYPTNDSELVDEIIHTLGVSGDEEVPRPRGEPTTFREALQRDYSITQPTPKFLRTIAQRASAAPTLHYLLAPDRKQDLETYLWGMEIIDFLLEHPSARFAPADFVGLLTKLQPRLYSVASSLKAYPEQVHFIVDVVRYESHGRLRKGVASSFLAERADDVPVPVFPSVAKHFHLPENPGTPIIMIGPGTGVAPFRAYLQERKATGAKGKNWLFFGAQHEHCDFAYGDEFKGYLTEELLTRLDCAWSRDQAQKVYVQHKMTENAAEIWKWIDTEGAHFFVCGDARRMAKDVDATLRNIVRDQGGKNIEQANEYVEKLKNEKRYKRDVY